MVATRIRLGARIRQLRMAQQLSQYRFSRMINMDRTYLIGVEKGRRNLTVDNLIRIADGLGITLSELFDGVQVEYDPSAYHTHRMHAAQNDQDRKSESQ